MCKSVCASCSRQGYPSSACDGLCGALQSSIQGPQLCGQGGLQGPGQKAYLPENIIGYNNPKSVDNNVISLFFISADLLGNLFNISASLLLDKCVLLLESKMEHLDHF